jgi:hypothetical protein
MRAIAWGSWQTAQPDARSANLIDKLARLIAIGLLSAVIAQTWMASSSLDGPPAETSKVESSPANATAYDGGEIVIAGYVGAPFYHRSDVHLTRPDGTDLQLKELGWDGDALHFPIDGGVRSVQWWQSFGFMVDFLHNKAVARLGKGAHGRKLSNPVIEEVETTGTLAGKPAPPRLKLTDLFDRLEFTHGHNVLLFTPLLRLPSLTSRVRPYVGVGGGFAIPHTEVWFRGDSRAVRTSEYQFAGPAAQLVAGLEFRTGRGSYFVEYKFTQAWIHSALTGDQSWLNFNMPGDLWRQFRRWLWDEEPKLGRISTTLGAHQIVVGAGYRWTRAPPAP